MGAWSSAMKARNVAAAVALFASVSLASLGTVCVATPAFAAKTKLVSIGEVIATAPRAQSKLGLVRTALEQELDTIDWRKSTQMKPYVVSVSVVNLETETTNKTVATTCELSTTVRNAKNGSVVVVMNQRVRAENEAVYARSVEDGAIRAAASAAIRKIPGALEGAKNPKG